MAGPTELDRAVPGLEELPPAVERDMNQLIAV